VALCLLFSWCFNEVSFVDRIWSVTPAIYSWVFTAAADFTNRNLLISILITAWACRLTYNFYRKGGYKIGEGEDYRWAIVKEKIGNRLLWQVFNVVFIAGYQNFLLLLIVLPQWFCNQWNQGSEIRTCDLFPTTMLLAGLILETVADEQQWLFQNEKALYKKDVDVPLKSNQSDLQNGFLTRGLFSWSRHPNFLGEQIVWVAVWLFAATHMNLESAFTHPSNLLSENKQVLQSGVGVFLLILLFQGSTVLTEWISVGKYPSYAEYQQKVGMLMPDVWKMTACKN